MSDELPRTLLEAVRYFSDEQRAFDFVVSLRWTDGRPVCPDCGSLEQSFISTRRIWKCKACKRQFSVRVGTIFEDSPIPFAKWLPCIWLIANSKNSISSYEVARAIGVTQKTAWFMLHRIRAAMETGTFQRLSGTVEVDETYVGGLADNMHKSTRARRIKARGNHGKTPVQGARERETGRVAAAVTPKMGKYETQINLRQWIEPGSALYTDESVLYQGVLERHYAHKAVNHSVEYVSGDVWTNGIENFWSLLKRAIKGTQVHVDPQHLQRYVTERTFAYNARSESDLTRMRLTTQGVAGRRLTWKELTTKPVLAGWPTY
jgi:transposase-like protein